MKKGFIALLKEGHRPVHGGLEGVLAQLYRKILFECHINQEQFTHYLNEFVANARSRTIDQEVIRTFTSQNLLREFGSEKMTWKSFVKALKCLGAVKIEFSVKLTRVDPNHSQKTIVTDHHVEIGLGHYYGPDRSNDSTEVEFDVQATKSNTASSDPYTLSDVTRRLLERHRAIARLRQGDHDHSTTTDAKE